MIFGLLLSIALMAVAAQLIARLIDRYRWIAYVGLLIVLVVAVKMIWEGGLEVFHACEHAGLTHRDRSNAWLLGTSRPCNRSVSLWASDFFL